MKPGSKNHALNHRRVLMDMLELALQGTAVSIVAAAVAMGLIAMLVS